MDQVIDEALRLPQGQRAEVAARLLESLDRSRDEEVDAAWAAEIELRCADRDSGRTVGPDWEEFRRQVEVEILGR
jgi:putative addiction module component (TIGR02574 family)